MVAQQVEVAQSVGRFVEVVAGGRRAGSVEWDHGKWIAHPEGCRSAWHADQDAAVADVVESFGRIAGRWSRALDRAIADGLDPVEVAGKWGYWFVESGSQPGVGYLVTDNGFRCTCPAGQQGDPVCKHRAAVKFVNGQLAAFGIEAAADTDPEPEPPAPVAPAGVCEVTGWPIAADGFYVDTCRACSGLGVRWSEWGRDAYSVTCDACGGSGRIAPAPAADPDPAGAARACFARCLAAHQ